METFEQPKDDNRVILTTREGDETSMPFTRFANLLETSMEPYHCMVVDLDRNNHIILSGMVYGLSLRDAYETAKGNTADMYPGVNARVYMADEEGNDMGTLWG